jgi:tetratricopeptide (TPR) repeat protein
MMGYYDRAVPETYAIRRSSPPVAGVLTLVAALLAGSQSFASDNSFRVVYADVPGVKQLEAGNLELGIEILEEQLNEGEQDKRSEVWATLCASYIIALALDKAEPACNKAVETGPTYAALNNRGVFRAYRGDYSGAHDDFDRARPLQLDAYLAELMSKDVRVVAADNYRLINIVLARRNSGQTSPAVASTTAEIEDPSQ